MSSITDATTVLPDEGPQSYIDKFEELKVMIFFSGLPFDSIRAEFEDEDIDPAMGFSATKLFNTMAWVDGHKGRLAPEAQDKVIFVDASDVVFGDLEGIEEDENEWLTAVAFGVEVFREYINKKIFQNIKGHVTVLLCAYSPAEPLMFAMSDIFLHFMDDEGLYTSFRSLSSSKFLNTFADLECHGWSFDVNHCCIFEGYELIMQKLGLDDRIKEAEMLLDMLRGQTIAYAAKQWNDAGHETPEFMKPIVDATRLYTPEEWNNLGYSFKSSMCDINGNEVVDEFKITFEDEQYTDKELQAKVDALKQEKKEAEEKAQEEWDDKSWDEQQQDIINRGNYLLEQENARWDRMQTELNEIDLLIKESDQKNFGYDNNPSNQLEVYTWNSQTNKGQDPEFFKLSGRSFGSVPFKGKWWTNWQLRELRSKYQKEHNEKLKEANDTIHEGNIYKTRKWIAVGHIAFAIGSIVFSPLSLLDIALEVYECDVTGDKIIHTMHEVNIMLDVVGLIPVVGGGIKLGKLLKAGQAIGNAAKLAGKELIKRGATALIKDGDDVLKAIAKEVPEEVLEARKFVEGAKAAGKLSDDAARELAEIEQTAKKLETAEEAATKAKGMESSVDFAKEQSSTLRGQATTTRGEATTARTNATNARTSADAAKGEAETARTNATNARTAANTADSEAQAARKSATKSRTKANKAKESIPKENPTTEELTQWKNSQGKKKYSTPNKKTERKWRKEYKKEREKRIEDATRHDREATRLEGEATTAEEKATKLDEKATQMNKDAVSAEARHNALEQNAIGKENKASTLEEKATQLEKDATEAENSANDLERKMKGLQEEGEKIADLQTQLQEKMGNLSQQLAEGFYQTSSMPVNSARGILGNLWEQSHLVSYGNAFKMAYNAGGRGIIGGMKGLGNVAWAIIKDVVPGLGYKGDIETGMKLFNNEMAARAWMLAQNIIVKPLWTFGQVSNVGFIWYNTDLTPVDYLKSNFNSENLVKSNTKNPNEVPGLKGEYGYSPYEELPDQPNGQLLHNIHDRGMDNAYKLPEEPAPYYSGESDEFDRGAIEQEQYENWEKEGRPVHPSRVPDECREDGNDMLGYTDETDGYADGSDWASYVDDMDTSDYSNGTGMLGVDEDNDILGYTDDADMMDYADELDNMGYADSLDNMSYDTPTDNMGYDDGMDNMDYPDDILSTPTK